MDYHKEKLLKICITRIINIRNPSIFKIELEKENQQKCLLT